MLHLTWQFAVPLPSREGFGEITAARLFVYGTRKSYQTRRGELCSPEISVNVFDCRGDHRSSKLVSDTAASYLNVSSWAECRDIVLIESNNYKSARSRTFFDGVVKKGEQAACLRSEGSTKRVYLNPTRHKILLLTQKDNIDRSRSRKLSWQFSLLDLFAILPLINPKVRLLTPLRYVTSFLWKLATRCLLRMTRFNMFCANPEQSGEHSSPLPKR